MNMSVTIYSASWCVPCQTAKKWIDDKGIEYIEKQVDDENNQNIFGDFCQRKKDRPYSQHHINLHQSHRVAKLRIK